MAALGLRSGLWLLCLGLLLGLSTRADAQAGVISPELESVLQAAGPTDEIAIIVTHSDQADLRQLPPRRERRLRRSRLIQTLQETANRSLPPLEASLRGAGARDLERLWILNGVAARVPARTVRSMARWPGVASIRLDGVLNEPVAAPAAVSAPEWNIDMIRAPEVWGQGYRGQGVVVANMDTGVDFNHPDLGGIWRGGANSWYDPYGQHATPYDANGHGTNVMGVMVGGDAGGTAIGVAPEAQWIAVKIFTDSGFASYSGIHKGFQWLLDPDGNPLTDDAPALVVNAWGLVDPEGSCNTLFLDDIRVLRTAGIAVIFAAGNEGPGTSSGSSPANYPESLGVGAVDSFGDVTFWSSRGPSRCDGSYFPAVVAPGLNVRTTDLTFGGLFPNSYLQVSGTSFAAPHVGGVITP